MDSDGDYDPADDNYGYGDVAQDEGGYDTGDYDYEWGSGHTPCGDDDN